jgi:xanthine/uracil/vitamin C permease (AzgA family)
MSLVSLKTSCTSDAFSMGALVGTSPATAYIESTVVDFSSSLSDSLPDAN